MSAIANTPVVFVFEGVVGTTRRGIAALPELLDEMFALRVGFETQESSALAFVDDVDDVFVEPQGVWVGLHLRRAWRTWAGDCACQAASAPTAASISMPAEKTGARAEAFG